MIEYILIIVLFIYCIYLNLRIKLLDSDIDILIEKINIIDEGAKKK